VVIANIVAGCWVQVFVPMHIGYPIPVPKPKLWTVAPSFLAFTFLAPQLSVLIVETRQAPSYNPNLNQIVIIVIESILLFFVSMTFKYAFLRIDANVISMGRFLVVKSLFVILVVFVGNVFGYLFSRSFVFFKGNSIVENGILEGLPVSVFAIVWSPQVVVSLPWFRVSEFPSPQLNFLFVVFVEVLILSTFLATIEVFDRCIYRKSVTELRKLA